MRAKGGLGGRDRLIRFLLRLYPAAFQREFGGEMRAVFLDEARTRTGTSRLQTSWFWVRTTGVTLWCALAEHATSARDRILLDSVPEREAARQRRFDTFRQQLISDVRDAIDEVERRPWRSAVVVGLAAGVAAVALAAVGVGRAGLWHLPYPAPHRLVSIETAFPDLDYESFPLSPFEFLGVKRLSTSYETVGAWVLGARNVRAGGHPTRERLLWATPGTFEALGLGTPEIPVAGQPRPIYATVEFMEAYFSGSESAVGETLEINSRTVRLAGILPADFRFWIADVSLWLPFVPDPQPDFESNHLFGVVARLNSGVSLDDAQREVAAIGEGWTKTHPNLHGPGESHPIRIRPLRQALIGASGPPFRLLLTSAAGLLLLALLHIAFVGRGTGRRVRRPASEFIERALLVTAGGAVGTGSALVGLLAWSQAGLGPFVAGRDSGAAGSLMLFGFLLAAALAVTLGLLRLSRMVRLGGALVVLDVAVAIALLAGAGLLARSISNLRALDPGFVPAGLLAFDAALPEAAAGTETIDQMADRVIDFAASLPGVTDVAITSSLPVSPALLPSDLHGRAGSDPDETLRRSHAYIHFVSAGYTDMMGIPLVKGRRIRGGLEAVVSASLARRLWPDGNALGAQVRPSHFELTATFATVVGIVDDVAQATLVEGEVAQLYVSRDLLPASAQGFLRGISVVMRTTDVPGTMHGLPLHLALEGRTIPISQPGRLDAKAQSAIRNLTLLLRLLAVGAALCATLGLITARMSAAQWTSRVRSLGPRLAVGVAGGLLLAITVRTALDPVLFKTGLADAPIAVGVTLCLIGWLAAAMRLGRLPDSR